MQSGDPKAGAAEWRAHWPLTLAALIGVSVGLISGYIGGWLDTVLMRMKKADLQLRTKNYPTAQATLFHAHESDLFGYSGLQRVERRLDHAPHIPLFALVPAVRLGRKLPETRRFEVFEQRERSAAPAPLGTSLAPAVPAHDNPGS